ncbi:MAG: hypothetical protein FJZ57_02855 [Chlamydiae bacterium]|nr:hypothetical protein [Chlamydiota bacterium]
MTKQPLILLHEESLRNSHPIFLFAPKETQVIYVWDDEYVLRSGYSLKRLIFIYETLCEMKVDILRGSTRDILQEISPSVVYIPTTNNGHLLEMIRSVEKFFPVEMVEDEPFVNLKKTMHYKRFFQYWSKVEKAASLQQGGQNA